MLGTHGCRRGATPYNRHHRCIWAARTAGNVGGTSVPEYTSSGPGDLPQALPGRSIRIWHRNLITLSCQPCAESRSLLQRVKSARRLGSVLGIIAELGLWVR